MQLAVRGVPGGQQGGSAMRASDKFPAKTRSTCGAQSGITAHKNNNEELCVPCKAVAAAAMKAWRDKNPRAATEQQKRSKLRERALRILGTRYPAELQTLIEELEAQDKAGG